ncbi:MAG: helix-turn-helix domain-containing protein [Bryobacteraceae bacterium]
MMTNPVVRPGLDRPVSLARIDAVIAVHLGPARVKGNAQPAAFHRQLAMYLAKHVGRWSTTRIGKFYNGRDHSTVCHAIRKIEALRNADPKVDHLLETLTERVLGSATDRARKQLSGGADTEILGNLRLQDGWLDLLADKIAERVLSHTCGPQKPLPQDAGASCNTLVTCDPDRS